MQPPLEQFQWKRPKDGFLWVDAGDVGYDPEKGSLGTRFLMEKPMQPQMLYRFYPPLTVYPTLYEKFAAIEPTEDGFQQFADKYGFLGVGELLRKTGPLRSCEPFVRWHQEHQRLRDVVEIVVAARRSDAGTLEQWFNVDDEFCRYERPYGTSPFPALSIVTSKAQEIRPWLWDWATSAATRDGMIIRFAMGFAQSEINRVLRGEGFGPNASTTARILFDVEMQQLGLHFVPSSLLGAMWLQVAKALTIEAVLKECEHCGNTFDAAQAKRPSRAMYCSQRCKLAAYRLRRKDREWKESMGSQAES